MDERKPGRSVVVRLDGEGVNWLYKPISFVPGVKVEFDEWNKLVRTEVLDEICVSVKAVTEALFREFTGVSDSQRVLSNFRRYYEDARVKLRAESILIPGYIDWQEIEKIASFIGKEGYIVWVSRKLPHRVAGESPVS